MEAELGADPGASVAAPTLVSFAAPSGTGKTTLICALLEELRARGHAVGALKSDAHGVELDTPGKDSHRMRQAGSLGTALVAPGQLAIFRDPPAPRVPLAAIVELFFSDLDFVLAEGFRSHGYPTIVLRRTGVDAGGWAWPSDVVAVASDTPSEERDFGLDDVAGIADFLCALRAGEATTPPGRASSQGGTA